MTVRRSESSTEQLRERMTKLPGRSKSWGGHTVVPVAKVVSVLGGVNNSQVVAISLVGETVVPVHTV